MPHVPPPKRHPYDQWSPDARALDLVGDKWTLLIVRDLVGGPRRFVELQRVLPGISTEQLRSRLNRMVADGLLTRKRYREVPPRVDYELTDRARQLMPALGELARWGYRWAWGAPRDSERVDVTAIFRLAAGLAPLAADLSGTVELRLDDTGASGQTAAYEVAVTDGAISLTERPAESPDASISADTAGWVAAFAPEADRSGLTITGDRSLAEKLLDALAPRSSRSASAAPPASAEQHAQTAA